MGGDKDIMTEEEKNTKIIFGKTQIYLRQILPRQDYILESDALESGDNFKIMECGMKAFPTEALTHTHLSCLLNAMIKVLMNGINPIKL